MISAFIRKLFGHVSATCLLLACPNNAKSMSPPTDCKFYVSQSDCVVDGEVIKQTHKKIKKDVVLTISVIRIKRVLKGAAAYPKDISVFYYSGEEAAAGRYPVPENPVEVEDERIFFLKKQRLSDGIGFFLFDKLPEAEMPGILETIRLEVKSDSKKRAHR